jgi:hypothetical protein
MTFNQVHDHFLDVDWIRCPERLAIRYKRTGIKYDCYYPNNYWFEHTRIFRERFGNVDFAVRKTFDLFTKEQVREMVDTPTVYVCFHVSDLTWSFKADIYGLQYGKNDEFDNWVHLWPRSNREITEESIMDTVWAFVDTLLFKAGRFRDIQQATGYSKAKVKELYRKYITEHEPSQVSDHDIRKAIRRKYNIEFSDCLDPAEHLAEALRHRDKSENTLWVMPEPDMSYILDGFDGDIDDLERVFNDEYPDYKPNTILV